MRKNLPTPVRFLNLLLLLAVVTSCGLIHTSNFETAIVTPSKSIVSTPPSASPHVTSTFSAYPVFVSTKDTLPYPPPVTLPTALPTVAKTFSPGPTTFPELGYNLLYMGSTGPNNYKLLYWDHKTGLTKTLVAEETDSTSNQGYFTLLGNVSDYSASSDGKKMVVLLVAYRPMDAPDYEFVYFDIPGRKINPLTWVGAPVYRSAISPNGLLVGYLSNGKVNFFPISNPERIFELGTCDSGCQNFIWSPDGKIIAASNQNGVWISDIASRSTKLLAAQRLLKVRDEKLAVFASPAWSPDGKFLLAFEPNSSTGEWYVIDTISKRMAKISNSFQYPEPTVRIFWLKDGRMCVLRSGNIENKLAPSIEIWHTTPEKESLITLDQTIPLPVNPNLVPISPIQLADGRIVFALVETKAPSTVNESGLYLVGSDNILSKISDQSFPFTGSQQMANVDWSPDGKGVIYQDLLGGIQSFIPMYHGFTPDIPPGSCCFTWVK